MEQLKFIHMLLLALGAIVMFAISVYARQLYVVYPRNHKELSFIVFLIIIILASLIGFALPLLS